MPEWGGILAALGGPEILLLSTHGGIRNRDGTPVALGYHTGHWEVGLLMQAAAEELKQAGAVPFAGYCTDPCDGRTQGTTGMFDSLPYRNDAAIIFRRLIRSLPTRRGVIGIATCDKGLPAMMMALAGTPDLPCVLVPGGVTLLPEAGEDAGTRPDPSARASPTTRSHSNMRPTWVCRACASPGGGCQFLGTAATSQVVGEALGMSLTHSALAPSGHPIWLDMARRSGRAVLSLDEARPPHARHPHRRLPPQRHDRPCRIRRIHQPDPASRRHRPRSRPIPAQSRRLGSRQPPGSSIWSTVFPMDRAISPLCKYFWLEPYRK